MDADEAQKNLASLQQSIQDSEASLRQLKQTIQAVDARLKHADHRAESVLNEASSW